jgi:hypothetical protein
LRSTNFKDQYENVCPGVYVWHNFLSKDELSPIIEEINSKHWDKDCRQNWEFKSFAEYKDRILESLNMPDADIPNMDNVIRRHPGDGMEPHVDIQNYMNPVYYNEIDKDSDVEKVSFKFARYGMIIYFNDDYELGDICYPEYDFSYKPKAGDLVMHDARNIHAVRKVKSGYRFTHSSYLSDLFWVTKEIADSVDKPNGRFDIEDSRFWYSISHGPSDNPALKELQKTYVYDGKF